MIHKIKSPSIVCGIKYEFTLIKTVISREISILDCYYSVSIHIPHKVHLHIEHLCLFGSELANIAQSWLACKLTYSYVHNDMYDKVNLYLTT